MRLFSTALFAAFAACSFAQLATDSTNPSLATDRTNPSLATDRTNPSLATDRTNPSLATDRTTPTLATDGPTITIPSCDIAWATSCLKTYIDSYGFTSTQTGVFPDPITFDNAVNAYIDKHGVNGLTTSRTWWFTLQQCLGPNTVLCLFEEKNLQQIFKTNVTGRDSTYWVITFFEEDYINSNDAFNVIRANYHCAAQVQKHSADALSYCNSTYFNDVQKDPNNVCYYQVAYMTCVQAIYTQSCGSKVGGFVCNEVAIPLRVFVSKCLENPSTKYICNSLTDNKMRSGALH